MEGLAAWPAGAKSRRGNPLVGFFHRNFIQVERVDFSPQAAQHMIKFYSHYTFVCSAPASPIWKSPIPPPPTLCVLCSQTRQIFRPAKRRRQPTCALRWIALLTFASPKKHNKVNWGSGGLKHTSHCLELARRQRRGSRGSIHLSGYISLATGAQYFSIGRYPSSRLFA